MNTFRTRSATLGALMLLASPWGIANEAIGAVAVKEGSVSLMAEADSWMGERRLEDAALPKIADAVPLDQQGLDVQLLGDGSVPDSEWERLDDSSGASLPKGAP